MRAGLSARSCLDRPRQCKICSGEACAEQHLKHGAKHAAAGVPERWHVTATKACDGSLVLLVTIKFKTTTWLIITVPTLAWWNDPFELVFDLGSREELWKSQGHRNLTCTRLSKAVGSFIVRYVNMRGIHCKWIRCDRERFFSFLRMLVPVKSLTFCQLARCWTARLLSVRIQISFVGGRDEIESSPSSMAMSSHLKTEQKLAFLLWFT